eukprot:CAMPEP_0197860046 /NCGR_PEP_ID=MMETSP1438-20131217/35141_1 /TAXON_ID=1461541 /ORGANISM="Pterosperma sp., Strain CCMP1384" /LENGTH=66 /DNA_ID=CAMNT_0043476763 /DNA_START=56 /DNA_END=256 /DNA_ORIENTATION=-
MTKPQIYRVGVLHYTITKPSSDVDLFQKLVYGLHHATVRASHNTELSPGKGGNLFGIQQDFISVLT